MKKMRRELHITVPAHFEQCIFSSDLSIRVETNNWQEKP